jgi:hypothetical protein
MMPLLRWIYARIGQMTCFAFAGLSFFSVALNDGADDTLPTAIIGAGFLAGGLVLRHQHRTGT